MKCYYQVYKNIKITKTLFKEIKMFRRIANRISGRKKSIDENLDIQEVLNLLNGLDKNVKGSIDDRAAFMYMVPTRDYIQGCSPQSMIDFINKEFPKDEKGFYNYAGHQIYSGKREEKHYLDLYSLFKKASDELTMKAHSSLHSALIKFIVEKDSSIS